MCKWHITRSHGSHGSHERGQPAGFRERDVDLRLLSFDGLVGDIRVSNEEIVMEYFPRDLENYVFNNAEHPLSPLATKVS
jgi:hypothetical protein